MIIQVNLGNNSYDIYIEKGVLDQAGRLCNLNRRVFIVTDSGVPCEYANRIASYSSIPTIETVPMGERSKSYELLVRLHSRMLENNFSREDCVVAVGGGVVGDLAGFAAATYMRGVDFYNIPTTVLSQVDSSIGGKTAINFGGVKNVIGAFWQPKKVLIDPDTLKTLPLRQISNGLAEALKMSITSDTELFRLFEEENPVDHLEEIITASVKIKKAVVEADERENGMRRVLNFGHTIGHGIESYEDLHGLYHGECVALGMIPMCSAKARERLIPILKKLGLPTNCPLDIEKVYSAMLHDKKANGDSSFVVMVNEPGEYVIQVVQLNELKRRMEAILK